MKHLFTLSKITVFVILFSVFSCQDQTEISVPTEELQAIDNAKLWYEANLASNEFSPSGRARQANKELRWHEAKTHDNNNLIEVPFDGTPQLQPFYRNDEDDAEGSGRFFPQYYKRMLFRKTGERRFEMVQLVVFPDKEPQQNGFSGTALLLDADGDFKAGRVYKNGRAVSKLDNKKPASKNKTSAHWVNVPHVVDWWQYSGGVWQYLDTDIYYTLEWVEDQYYNSNNNDNYYFEGDGNYYQSSSMVDNSSSILNLVLLSPDRPISSMIDYLKCFNINQSATITIYVNQPVPNSSATHNGGVVGHTFISISQNGNTSVFGFYPSTDNIYPVFNESDPSAMGDDSGSFFDVSISIIVSGNTLQQIINYSTNYSNTYDLNNYNCSDFGISIGNIAGLSLPDAYGSWPGGGGSNPGVLGQHIRSFSSSGNIVVNKSGGNAPNNQKGC